MTLIVENGSGVAGANSNVDVAFVTQYLTDRGNEAGWIAAAPAIQEASCILATDHIEDANRGAFLGTKFWTDISQARATLAFAAQPADTETVTIGTTTYTFVAVGPPLNANEVLIGAFTSDTIGNLVDAINANPDTLGQTYGPGTVQNTGASAAAFIGDTMLTLSRFLGTAGNSVVTTSTAVSATWNFPTLVGGTDVVIRQPLSFPRRGLFDRDGVLVEGMPLRLLYATSEYAVRALPVAPSTIPTPLAPDPAIDPLGGSITGLREKVGPIETETTYSEGTAGSGSLPAYPAADRLLTEFLRGGGVAIRG